MLIYLGKTEFFHNRLNKFFETAKELQIKLPRQRLDVGEVIIGDLIDESMNDKRDIGKMEDSFLARSHCLNEKN